MNISQQNCGVTVRGQKWKVYGIPVSVTRNEVGHRSAVPNSKRVLWFEEFTSVHARKTWWINDDAWCISCDNHIWASLMQEPEVKSCATANTKIPIPCPQIGRVTRKWRSTWSRLGYHWWLPKGLHLGTGHMYRLMMQLLYLYVWYIISWYHIISMCLKDLKGREKCSWELQNLQVGWSSKVSTWLTGSRTTPFNLEHRNQIWKHGTTWDLHFIYHFM